MTTTTTKPETHDLFLAAPHGGWVELQMTSDSDTVVCHNSAGLEWSCSREEASSRIAELLANGWRAL